MLNRVSRNLVQIVLALMLSILAGTLPGHTAPRDVQDIILPETDEYIVLLARHSEFLVTDGPETTLEEVRGAEGWQENQTDGFEMRDRSKTYWIRFGVSNPKSEIEALVLDLRAIAHDYVRAFEVDENGKITQLIETDRNSPFRERDIAATRLNAAFALAPGETKDIYLQVDPYFATRYGFVLASELTFRIFDQVNEDWSLFWYGGMLVVLTLAILSLPLTGWRVTLAFISMISCAVITAMAAEGVLAQYVFPEKPAWLGWHITDFFYYHTMTSLLIVGIFLFDLKKERPRYTVWVLGVVAYISCLSLLSFRWNSYDSEIILALYRAVLPLSFLTHLTTGILSVRLKKPGATALLIASLIPLVFAVNAALFGAAFEIPSPPVFELAEFRNLILIQLVVIAFAIIQRYARIRSERDRALRTELQTTQEKLSLSEELRESRENYDRVKRQSEQQREQLSVVSHDILQPLQSLRSGLKSLNFKDESVIQNMHDAFDYLESLARNSMTTPIAETGNVPSGLEVFPLNSVTDVAYAMFKDDAERSGVSFAYKPDDVEVKSEPITLMRIINNALANALKHSEASELSLYSLPSSSGTQLVIRDNGVGMSEEDLLALSLRHAKGEASDGAGLGLSVMQEECERLGLTLDVSSQSGVGTTIAITFPAGSATN